jgi:hypothetical protein
MQAPFDFDLFGQPIAEPKTKPARGLSPRDVRKQLQIFWLRNPEAAAYRAPEVPREKIVLIGCGKSKRSTAAKAKDLYTGPLFKARRKAAEASGARWFIVSALHGLVDPETVLEPYDVRLGDDAPRGTMFQPTRRNAIAAWGRGVTAALAALVDGRADIELHAGKDYRDGIAAAHAAFVASITAPAAGLGVGQQLAFYKNQTR